MRPISALALGLSATSLLLLVPRPADAQESRILAFGDSLSIGFREPGVDCSRPQETAKGYAEHLEELLAAEGVQVSVDPFGVCGETTFSGVSRIERVLADEPAEAIIIMEGTNDISSGNPVISLESILANLRLMADKSAAAGVEPVMASIIPYGPGVDGLMRNQRAARLAERLDEISREDCRAYGDVFNFLLPTPGLFSTYYASDGFHLNAAGYELMAEVFVEPAQEALASRCEPGPCVESDTTLCVGPDGRFEVRAEWRLDDGSEGVGHAVPFSSDTGKFWFFSPENIELVVKVLDGSCFNDKIWVFYGALSNVEYSIKVTDRSTCVRRGYFNPAGTFASAGDTAAFEGDSSLCSPEPGG